MHLLTREDDMKSGQKLFNFPDYAPPSVSGRKTRGMPNTPPPSVLSRRKVAQYPSSSGGAVKTPQAGRKSAQPARNVGASVVRSVFGLSNKVAHPSSLLQPKRVRANYPPPSVSDVVISQAPAPFPSNAPEPPVGVTDLLPSLSDIAGGLLTNTGGTGAQPDVQVVPAVATAWGMDDAMNPWLIGAGVLAVGALVYYATK